MGCGGGLRKIDDENGGGEEKMSFIARGTEGTDVRSATGSEGRIM